MAQLITSIILIGLLISTILGFKKKPIILGCGLVGFNGTDAFDPQKIITLMLANTTRGKHSTGMYNAGKITKEAVDAVEFLAKNPLIPEKVFIGHDRFATVGVKTAENAHPFEYDGTILVHNGTLTNHWALAREAGFEYKDFNVDSQIMTALISQQKGTYQVLSQFEGAAALIWTDRDDPTAIYVFRNSERPLFFGQCEEGMYISSIEDSLKLIGCRKIKSFKTEYVYYIKNGHIDVNKGKRIIRKKKSTYSSGYSSSYKGSESSSTGSQCIEPMWLRSKWDNTMYNLTKDRFYRIVKRATSGYFTIIDDYGKEVSLYRSLLADDDTMCPGDFLVALHTSDNLLIQANKVYMYESLKTSTYNDYIITVTDVLTGKSYSWSYEHFRLMTSDEVAKFFKENKDAAQMKLPIEEDETDSKDEDDSEKKSKVSSSTDDTKEDDISIFDPESINNTLVNLYTTFELLNGKIEMLRADIAAIRIINDDEIIGEELGQTEDEIGDLADSIEEVINEFELYIEKIDYEK